MKIQQKVMPLVGEGLLPCLANGFLAAAAAAATTVSRAGQRAKIVPTVATAGCVCPCVCACMHTCITRPVVVGVRVHVLARVLLDGATTHVRITPFALRSRALQLGAVARTRVCVTAPHCMQTAALVCRR